MKNDSIEEQFSTFSQSVFDNCYMDVAPWYKSVGLRNNQLKYNTFQEKGDCTLAEDFLINSKYYAENKEAQHSIVAYFTDAMLMNVHRQADPWDNTRKEDFSAYKKIALPKGVALPLSIEKAIFKRRSIRKFTGDPINLDYLATLFRCAGGTSGYSTTQLSDNSKLKIALRTVASGGGLYPVDILCLALHIDGLEKGIYQYVPQTDEKDYLVQLTGREKVTPIVDALAIPDDSLQINLASAVFLLTARPWKSMRKYGARGLRFVFIETGAISQNINLASTALGIGSCDYAGFIDADIEKALGFDGMHQTLLHTIVAGII